MEKRKKIEEYSLPQEIIFQVLMELPVKSLLRLRCVSKLWCSIIDNPFFVHSHNTRSHTRPGGISMLLFTMNFDVYTLEYADPEGGQVHHILDLRSEFSNPPQYANSLIRIDNCICNPSTRECITIPPIPRSSLEFDPDPNPDSFFGFDPSTKKYKVLTRFYTTTKRGGYQEETRFVYKILTLGTNSWRDIDDFIPHQLNGSSCWRGNCCCIEGVIYSLYTNRNGDEDEDVLVVFEVGHEKLRVMPLPQGTNFYSRFIQVGECLAMMNYNCKTIWILEDYYKQLWNKQSLVMMYQGKPLVIKDGVEMRPFGTIHTCEILVDLFIFPDTPKLCYYDRQSKKLRIVNLRNKEADDVDFCTKQVESLLPLKEL